MTDTQHVDTIRATDILCEYHALVRPARDRLAANPGVRGLTSPETDARTMAAFLLHFSALSVPITEPVEGWIRRAGERCADAGLNELSKALYLHSKAEAGHHLYHVNDFEAMVEVWNRRWSPRVNPDQITGIGLTRGGARYREVHEQNIESDTPYCQLAIEYEIELLPVEFGPPFVQNCVRALGPDILQCMTFVTSHVEFDVGHTKFNAHYLTRLIAEDMSRLVPLANAGTAALDAFGTHLAECWEFGVSLACRSVQR